MGKHTPADEQRCLVDLWHQSDGSIAAFALAHGVRPATFGTWVSRHRAPVPPRGFLQLAVADEDRVEPACTAATFAVEVHQHLLRFETPPPPAWFATVLHELGSC